MPSFALVSVFLLSILAGCGTARPITTPIGETVIRGRLRIRPIEFATTDFYFRPSVVRAEEGWLEVPARRDSAGGRTLRIHFVRFPSTAANPGPPIVYLAGGPGGSGTHSASGDRFPLFMRFRTVADVIALDQRGTTYAEPSPSCPGSWSYPLDRKLDAAILQATLRPFLAACVSALGDSTDLSAFNTRESADDLEDLRKALGSERLTLWGISYGTHLGLAYLKRYPARVHAAILAGVEGPDATYKLPSNLDRVLLRIDSALRADPRAHRVLPSLTDGLRGALSRLVANPTVEIQHPGTGETLRVTLGPEDLRRGLYLAMQERSDIEGILTRIVPMFKGDFTFLARYALRTRLANTESVMALGMDCASGATAARRARIESEAASGLLGDIANLDLRVRCAAWPVSDLGDGFRELVRADVRALLISGSLDLRTPPATAEEVLPGLSRAHHLVIDGAAHDDDLFLSSPKLATAMIRFLETGDPGIERIRLRPLRFKLP